MFAFLWSCKMKWCHTNRLILFWWHTTRLYYIPACVQVCVYLCVRLYHHVIIYQITRLTVSIRATGLEIEATELQIMSDLKMHNYTVGKPWCFWASHTRGAVVAVLGEYLGAAGSAAWSCQGSIDVLMCDWVGLQRLLKDWIIGGSWELVSRFIGIVCEWFGQTKEKAKAMPLYVWEVWSLKGKKSCWVLQGMVFFNIKKSIGICHLNR